MLHYVYTVVCVCMCICLLIIRHPVQICWFHWISHPLYEMVADLESPNVNWFVTLILEGNHADLAPAGLLVLYQGPAPFQTWNMVLYKPSPYTSVDWKHRPELEEVGTSLPLLPTPSPLCIKKKKINQSNVYLGFPFRCYLHPMPSVISAARFLCTSSVRGAESGPQHSVFGCGQASPVSLASTGGRLELSLIVSWVHSRRWGAIQVKW